MITRRAFTIGIVSTIAVPIIVRANKIIGVGVEHDNEIIAAKTFDLKGSNRFWMTSCNLYCCKFLFDETTDLVTINWCRMEGCTFDGFEYLIGRSTNEFKYNAIMGCTGVTDKLDESNFVYQSSGSPQCVAATS